MALGDTTPFDQSIADRANGIHDFDNDTWKLALVTILPTAADPDPRWGAGGGTDLSLNEATPGGNYLANGITLTNVTYAQTAGTAAFKSDAVSILVSATNPANPVGAVIYNDTSPGKQALFFLDFGGVRDLTASDLNINPDIDSGWFTAGVV